VQVPDPPESWTQRQTLITPKAIREMIEIISEHVRLQGENQAPELERARRRIPSLSASQKGLAEATCVWIRRLRP